MGSVVFLCFVVFLFVGLPVLIVVVPRLLTEAELKKEIIRARRPSVRVPLKRRLLKAALTAATWLVVCPFFGYILGAIAAFGGPGSNGYIFFFPSLDIAVVGACVHAAAIVRSASVPVDQP